MIEEFSEYMREEKGLSPVTTRKRRRKSSTSAAPGKLREVLPPLTSKDSLDCA